MRPCTIQCEKMIVSFVFCCEVCHILPSYFAARSNRENTQLRHSTSEMNHCSALAVSRTCIAAALAVDRAAGCAGVPAGNANPLLSVELFGVGWPTDPKRFLPNCDRPASHKLPATLPRAAFDTSRRRRCVGRPPFFTDFPHLSRKRSSFSRLPFFLFAVVV